ncbi:MAG: efflux RND transporter periplasmic adaptor subunit [Terriglobales bacterium]|jgi:multidrug efflux system membrane fusion protein
MENKPPASTVELQQQHHTEPPSHPHKSRWQRLFVWAALLLTFGVIFMLVLRHHDDAQSAASSRRGVTGPVTVVTAVAQKGNIGVYLDAIGTVTPVHTDSITSQVTGMITQVHYQEGQLVRKGQALIDIDPRPYEAQLLQAQGALERDTYVLEQAKMDLQRYRDAWARNGIPKQTLDDQEKIVLQDEGTVKNDQGTVQYDQVQVGWCHITAPIAGRVGLRLVDPGNVVQSTGTTTLVVITEVQPITVVFTIAEDSLPQVQAQTRHGKRLEVDAYDRAQLTKIATGKLLTLDNQIDTTTGTVKLRALYDNKNDALFPNQFVNTSLLVNTLQGVTLIPTSAIQHNGQTSFVYIIQNGTAQIRNIKSGVTNAGQTAVEGINPGDAVANSSFDKLQNNSKVTISKQPLPGTTSEGPAP